jgi:serine/threonine protein phosphatase 1
MGRLFAIGDVHGCLDELAVLLDAIAPQAGDEVVFVGDYVDRGPASRGVVDRLLATAAARPDVDWVFLKGNHEDMFLSFLGLEGEHGDVFLRNGGRATLASYGIAPDGPASEQIRVLPPAHLEFFRGLRMHHRVGRFLFVHAGVSPILPLESQSDDALLWIREEFIRNRHLLPYTVVFGHTPHREVFWHLPYKIGLDTGCVYGNKLSCLEFRGGSLFQVRKGSTEAVRSSGTPELDAVAELAAATESGTQDLSPFRGRP